MKATEKYFLFNKRPDFQRGVWQNLRWGDQGLCLEDPDGPRGVYLSPLLDSREKETAWHRGLIKSRSLGDGSLVFSFYCTDSPDLTDQHGRFWKLSDYLKTDQVELWEKEQTLQPYLVRRVQDPKDLLLHDVTGRYLWFKVRFFGQQGRSPSVAGVKLLFPKASWLDYLPEVYQRDAGGFLDRYLSLFQSLYDDLDQEIRQVSSSLELDTADKEFLEWLAGWLGMEEGYLWEEEKLRYLLRHAMEFYSSKGTVASLKKLVKLSTGVEPYVVEQHQLEPFRRDVVQMDRLKRIYGEDPTVVTVCLPASAVPSNRAFQTLMKQMEQVKPAQVEIQLVLLKPYLFLDGYTYLGVNSVLGRYEPLHLDGHSTVPLITVGGAEEREDRT